MDVLIKDDDFFDELRNDRSSLLDEYRDNMLTYLKQCFPTIKRDKLSELVIREMRKDLCPKPVQFIYSPSKGNFELKKGTVLDYIKATNGYIKTPSGASFVQPKERFSVFTPLILEKQAERKLVKKDEILAEAKGDTELAMIKNREQANIKIGINIFSGVMLANVTYRSSAHYNAITSTARFGTMTGYAFTERTIADNYYFSSENQAINWVINLLRIYPGDEELQAVLQQYNLIDIDRDSLLHRMCTAVNTYTPFCKNFHLKELIGSLTQMQVNYVFYAGNLNRIMFTNPGTKDIITDIMDITNIPEYTGPIKSIFELKDDTLCVLVNILLSDDFVDADGKTITHDRIDSEFPVVANRIISLYHVIEKKFANLENLFDVLLNLSVLPADSLNHKNMVRKTVILSDTDSIILTLIHWAEWYTGESKVSKTALNVASIIVALLSKMFEYLFVTLLMRLGVERKFMRKLVMKNEFTFSVLIRTVISKHYAGYITIREGQIISPSKLELKGKNFISSTLCKETLGNTNDLIKFILDSAIDDIPITFRELIRKAVKFEQRIVQSTLSGETTFLEMLPIKREGEYKKPFSSNFLYYEVWTAVFSEKYGPLALPQKCRVIPIKPITATTYKLIFTNESMHKGWGKFFKKFPQKKIKRIFIPLTVEIPPEIVPIIDHGKILSMNCYALNLILKSCNILTTTSFSDNYPALAAEMAEEVKSELT